MKLSSFVVISSLFGSVSAFSSLMTSNRHCKRVALYGKRNKGVRYASGWEKIKSNYKGLEWADYEAAVDPEEIPDIPFTEEDFAKALELDTLEFSYNDVVRGTCVGYDRGGCLVDIGAKTSAFLPATETSLDGRVKASKVVDINQEMDFQIISGADRRGQYTLSLRRLQLREAWNDILAKQKEDSVYEAEILAVNRGGCVCSVFGLRAFLPGSHLSGVVPSEDMIGKKVPFKFLEVNEETAKLVISNRKAVVETQMSRLSRGDVVLGEVQAIKEYGVFVRIEDMNGLLHISQVSYDRIESLLDVFEQGQQVKCMIIDHDKVNARIALSTKVLEPEPGAMLRNPEMVFDNAEATAKKYHEKMEKERLAREEMTRGIVSGLMADSLGGLGLDGEGDSSSPSEEGGDDDFDPLASVSDSLNSLLS